MSHPRASRGMVPTIRLDATANAGALLNATADLTGEDSLRRKAAAWEASAGSPPLRIAAVARKVAFRAVYPRRPI